MHLLWADVTPGDGPAISTSVQPGEAAALARLAADAGDVLEIGSAYGYSAVVMALAGAHVTAVDPHSWIPGSLAAMEGNLAAYGLSDQVAIRQETAASAMSALEAAGARFGLVFIDGDHAAHAVHHDVTAALKILRPDGVLACHDYAETCCCPGVAQALDQLYPGGPSRMVDTMFILETRT